MNKVHSWQIRNKTTKNPEITAGMSSSRGSWFDAKMKMKMKIRTWRSMERCSSSKIKHAEIAVIKAVISSDGRTKYVQV